jgi:carbonic anhydrase
VPPELVFDRGLGDLFVVRTGAQTVDKVTLGSVEFGPTELGTGLIVVLGHERCGAVTATIDAIQHHGGRASGHIRRPSSTRCAPHMTLPSANPGT